VVRPEFLPVCAYFIFGFIIPIILGFTWIRPDADRSGQPGGLWAVLTIPFGWITVLVYVAIRSLRASGTEG
jgi:hypothetical protein